MTAPAWMARFTRPIPDPVGESARAEVASLPAVDPASLAGVARPAATRAIESRPAADTDSEGPGAGMDLSEADRDRVIALLHRLALRSFKLTLDRDDDNQIAIETDEEVPPELVDRLKEHKPAILAVLKAQARAAELLKARTDVAAEIRTACIECSWGRVWLVPERTGADQIEATWTELHEDPEGTLARCQALGNAVQIFEGKLLANGPPLPASEPAALPPPAADQPRGS